MIEARRKVDTEIGTLLLMLGSMKDDDSKSELICCLMTVHDSFKK